MEHRRKNDLIIAMLILGYQQDTYQSRKNRLVFCSNDRCIAFENWEMLEEWLRTKYYNSEVTKERVEFILWPEKYVKR